jgi:hypothetical protein
VTSVTIGPIVVGKTPRELTLDTANPQVPINQAFGHNSELTLLGYNLTDGRGEPVSQLYASDVVQASALTSDLQLTLYWRDEAALELDYTTFVHLRNGEGEIVTQKDQRPLQGAYPTSLWSPGEIIADPIQISVPSALPQGEYTLVIGMYDFYTGQRLSVPENLNNEVTLAKFKVGS